MNCEAMDDMFELYSLGLLEGAEKNELEAHLGRNCPTCLSNYKSALELNSVLLSLTPDVEPPARLKRRVMASVGVEPKSWWGWASLVAAAGMLVVTLWIGNQERQRTADLAQAREAIAGMSSEREQLQQALRMLDQPETRQVTFGKDQPAPPRGNVFIHARLGVMLIASNLPKLAPGKTYQMWLVPKEGAPKPAGLFQSSDRQSAMHFLAGPVDSAALAAVAVSVEPEAGSSAPTTTPLIVAAAGA
jgi:Anti-sigma-K factor rskA